MNAEQTPTPPPPPPLPEPPAVPPELEVRWPRELLDADPLLAAEAFARSLRGYARRLATPELRARFCMAVDTPLYEAIDATVLEACGGVHPKHRLTRYHDFFVERIGRGERAVDLGCGIGMVAASIAERSGAAVVGLDWSEHNLAMARRIAAERKLGDRLSYHRGDIREHRVPGTFDAIVLSNVLEHIADRPRRLRTWAEWYRPKRVLIRVPAWDRDWRVPYKDEIGVDSRSDPTHETEYTEERIRREIREAGMRCDELIVRWGEYWACAAPA